VLPPWCQQIEPAETAAEHDAGLPGLVQDRRQTVRPPDRAQVGHAAALDPDDVLLQQMLADVRDVRHREQGQMDGRNSVPGERRIARTDQSLRIAVAWASTQIRGFEAPDSSAANRWIGPMWTS
jgi:hypothetical protein